MPGELQGEVHAVVCQTKHRSGWPARRTLKQLGISPASYYRWRKESQQAKGLPSEPARPVQAYEATDEEKRGVRTYALKHPGIRHRELAWRMVDEEIACLSPSTVYRILKGENLVCPWRRRTKRTREDEEKATHPDEIWATDLMYLIIGGRTYYLVNFLDEYSRLVVHHALVSNMEGATVSVECKRQSNNSSGRREARSRRAGCRGSAPTTGAATSRGSSAEYWTSTHSGISGSSRIAPRRTGSLSEVTGRYGRLWRARS